MNSTSSFRSILHVDMDAFYASVEQRDNPEFKGKPVIVGAAPRMGRGRGVVSAASYEARKYGIHSAQPISRAYRLCPNGIFLPVRGKRYVQVSRCIMAIFREYTPVVGTISLDEAFLDMTGTERLFGKVEAIGREIKNRIWESQNLTASVGIGPNKLIAKIASDLDKPDGFIVVKPESVCDFLSPLPVRKLWGIGKQTGEVLNRMGIHTVCHLAKIPRKILNDNFGRMGDLLWNYARGIDESPVISDHEVKSVSNERTFSQDVTDEARLHQTLLALSEKVGFRLRNQELMGRTVTLKVRLADFTTFVRHATLPRPFFMSETIYREVFQLFRNLDTLGQPIRLLGVGVTQLSTAGEGQIDMFAEEDANRIKVSNAVDRLKHKYGDRIIRRGCV